MIDMIPKGNGNSRYLKSVSNFLTLYPTYADFVAALVAGTLPVDFNGLNSAGIQQLGTPLNKANLLTDATASAIQALQEGSTPSTPNEALNLLASAVAAGAKVQTGSYVGTGTYGSANPCSLSFDFVPIVVVMLAYQSLNAQNSVAIFGWDTGTTGSTYYTGISVVPVAALNETYRRGASFTSHFVNDQSFGKRSSDGKTIYWYNATSNQGQFNDSNTTFWWAAIGV